MIQLEVVVWMMDGVKLVNPKTQKWTSLKKTCFLKGPIRSYSEQPNLTKSAQSISDQTLTNI